MEHDVRLIRHLRTLSKHAPLVRTIIAIALVTGILFGLSRLKARGGASEAKEVLSALLQAERNHFKRWQRYELDLEKIGFRLERTQLKYVISFIPACAAKHGVLESSVTSTLDLASRGIASTVSHTNLSAADLERVRRVLDDYKDYRCPHPLEGFVAMAIGNIDGDSDLDVWLVDEMSELQHLESDL